MFGLWVATAFLAASSILKIDVERLIKKKALPAKTNAADLSSTICLLSGVTGIIGARIFHILENFGEFMSDPASMIFSRGGYTVLGGLIVGVIVCGRYVVKKGLRLPVMLDATAPAMMMGYAVGRIGCQLSGDGDWGIASNLALKPSWLPEFMWAFQYKGNILGVVIPPPGVYPTPMYESAMAFLSFGLLWYLRDQKHKAGWLFAVYSFMTGFERFFVEKIRVNTKYDFGFIQMTQAEILSIFLMAGGIYWMLKLWKPEDAKR